MLSVEHITSAPTHVDWDAVGDLDQIVVMPSPTLADLDEYEHAPEDLRDAGLEVPDDEDGISAIEFARAEFLGSAAGDEWRMQHHPAMAVLWPCDFSDAQAEAIAGTINESNLACSLVRLERGDETVKGIALTGGGMNLADHIAGAYILCGYVPPFEVLESALENGPRVMREEIAQAAERASEHLQARADRLRELNGHEDRIDARP